MSYYVNAEKADVRSSFFKEAVFRAFCRDTIDRHVNRGLDPVLWKVILLFFQMEDSRRLYIKIYKDEGQRKI